VKQKKKKREQSATGNLCFDDESVERGRDVNREKSRSNYRRPVLAYSLLRFSYPYLTNDKPKLKFSRVPMPRP